MKVQKMTAVLIAASVLVGSLIAPIASTAKQSSEEQSHRRQKTKNDWRNIAIGSGAATLFGILKHDNTITFAGAAGTLYSLDRYEKDRRSQSRTDHARAQAFGKTSFYRNGHRYVRKSVKRDGKRYYQFVRG